MSALLVYEGVEYYALAEGVEMRLSDRYKKDGALVECGGPMFVGEVTGGPGYWRRVESFAECKESVRQAGLDLMLDTIDAPETYGVITDNSEALKNALARIAELEARAADDAMAASLLSLDLAPDVELLEAEALAKTLLIKAQIDEPRSFEPDPCDHHYQWVGQAPSRVCVKCRQAETKDASFVKDHSQSHPFTCPSCRLGGSYYARESSSGYTTYAFKDCGCGNVWGYTYGNDERPDVILALDEESG